MEPIARLLPVLAAPFVGSFLGVLVRRLPQGRPVVLGRSCCEVCGKTLRPFELVPIASFLALCGRCSSCGQPIPRFHLVIELAALMVPLSALAAGVRTPEVLWSGCLLGWTLLAVAWIDAGYFVLPDVLTLPLLVAGLSACAFRTPDLLADRALAAIAGYVGFRAIALVYRRIRGREGLGPGDAKLFAAGGSWLGLAAMPDALLAAALAGLLGAAALRLRNARVAMDTRLAFGPALALGIWSAWLVLG